MAETVSILIPTISRPTLARALASLRSQEWIPGDEVLVVGDGPQPIARELWERFGLPGRYVETPRAGGVWGHAARNWVLDGRLARGAYLMCLDDDDEYTPGAIATVRAALAEAPGRPHIFRMTGRHHGLLWKTPELVEGNVGTPMIVAPNDPARLGRFATNRCGDTVFIRDTCSHYPDGPVWREEVICLVRPSARSK